MSLGFRDIDGLTHNQANDGIPIASIPGDTAGPVTTIVMFATASGLPPSDPSITIQLFPTGKFSTGVDSNGNISVTATLVNSGDDKLFNIAGGGSVTLDNGFWAATIRGSVNTTDGTRGFDLQFGSLDPGDFGGVLTQSTTTPDAADTSWDSDEEKGNTDISFDYDNSSLENPTGFIILRDGVYVGTVPWASGTTHYTYTDYVFAEGDYSYTTQVFKYDSPNAISASSSPVVVSFSGTSPDINITGDINLDISLASTIVFISDASGIYTLVTNKKHDTLYDRTGLVTVDVKIPDPFARTGFV